MEICCNEVTQVSVNDTTIVLICTVSTCGVRATADLRLANHEWMCSVGLMRWVSHATRVKC